MASCRLLKRWLRLTVPMVAAVLLSACQVTPGPGWDIIARLSGPGVQQPQHPDLEFMRLSRSGSVAYLALGYREGAVEHWYSADRIVLRLDDGRIAQWLGAPVEWRAAALQQRPTWSRLAQAGEPLTWQRRHDEMPGYRYGVIDEIESHRVHAGPVGVPDLNVVPGQTLVWVREEVRSTLVDGSAWTHDQWFALAGQADRWQVLWSRQCVAPEWCFEIQPLPRP